MVEKVGSVDILVNNDGFYKSGRTAELDVTSFDRLFAANVRAPYLLVAALAPKMAARGSGSIINVGCMASQIGILGGAAYGATKAASASLSVRGQPNSAPRVCVSTQSRPDRFTRRFNPTR